MPALGLYPTLSCCSVPLQHIATLSIAFSTPFSIQDTLKIKFRLSPFYM